MCLVLVSPHCFVAAVHDTYAHYRIIPPPIPVVVPFGYLHVPVHVPSGPLLQVEFVPSEVTVQVPVPPSQ